MGHAKLMGKAKVGALTSLGALILNDNALTSISGKECTALQCCDLALMTTTALADHPFSVPCMLATVITLILQPVIRCLVAPAGLKEIKGLNTLVLKNNAFTDLGKSLHHCTALSKLSMAHNQLSDLSDSLKVSFLARHSP